MSSGEFVGAVVDDLQARIEQKIFHCEIQNDHGAIKAEEESYAPIPESGMVTQAEIDDNYQRIKDVVAAIIEEEMERIYDTPEPAHLLISRPE